MKAFRTLALRWRRKLALSPEQAELIVTTDDTTMVGGAGKKVEIDGRVELMEQQRVDFEPANPGAECYFHTIDTSGPKTETQAKVEALLKDAKVM